eukprot:TRINITY_DN16786_c1_g1_i1.p1 TRINITY_DN16786_c1_g1~~TRINITY_DN16786_c1_g1_i1.p1  ORF type:complete len:493 (+),score=111.19 TRINITY_DN16786_c1_g1_i1:161-1639(+)
MVPAGQRVPPGAGGPGQWGALDPRWGGAEAELAAATAGDNSLDPDVVYKWVDLVDLNSIRAQLAMPPVPVPAAPQQCGGLPYGGCMGNGGMPFPEAAMPLGGYGEVPVPSRIPDHAAYGGQRQGHLGGAAHWDGDAAWNGPPSRGGGGHWGGCGGHQGHGDRGGGWRRDRDHDGGGKGGPNRNRGGNAGGGSAAHSSGGGAPSAVIETTEALAEDLRAALTSLYEDRISPLSSYVKARLKERSCSEAVVNEAMNLYGRFPHLFDIQRGEREDETRVFLKEVPSWFRGWVDFDDPEDPYDEKLWNEFSAYLKNVNSFAGGRYGMARELQNLHLPFLQGRSLGELCHLVQLALQKHQLLVYHRKMLKPIQQVLEKQENNGAVADSDDYGEIRDMDDLILVLFRILIHKPGGIPLCQMKRMIKFMFRRELSETAFQCTKLVNVFEKEPLASTFVLDNKDDKNALSVVMGDTESFPPHIKRLLAMAKSAERDTVRS